MCHKCSMRNLINRVKALFKPKVEPTIVELTILQKLNAKFGPVLEGIAFDYNQRHVHLDKEIGNKYDLSGHLRPTIVESGYTNAKKHKGAFMLNPPAQILRAPLMAANCHGIYRVSLSYEWAIRSLDKEDTKEFRLLVRTVLDDFSKCLDLKFSDDTAGTARFQVNMLGRPTTDEYFVELSSCAGFEFRIYSDCINLEKVRK